MTTRVSVRNLGKFYKLYRSQADRVKECVFLGKRSLHEKHWALKDVSFDLAEGEALGVIGQNGAGKSTLLKIISGTAYPTHGEVRVNGRLTALLELGAGFHPEFTGRENLYLNARLMGLSQEEIQDRVEQVVEFADLGEYIDQPVRTYSTGMQVRLGFAVASSVNPDIMVVDEALAVGDAYFRKKCLDRVKEFRNQGLSFLFVSHDLPVVLRFCPKCMWLRDGQIEQMGDTSSVINDYRVYAKDVQCGKLKEAQPGTPLARRRGQKARWGDGPIKIERVEILGEDGVARWAFQMGEKVLLRLHYKTETKLDQPVFSFQIERLDGVYVMGTSNADNNIDTCPLGPISGEGVVEYEIESLNLHGGAYFLSVQAFSEPDEPFWADPSDHHYQMYEFRVFSPHRQHGIVALPGRWKRVGVRV